MKSTKVFAIALLLSTGAAQADFDFNRGVSDVLLGLTVGALGVKYAPTGVATSAANALAQSAVIDGLLDEANEVKRSQFEVASYAMKRAKHAVAMFATSFAVKSLAIGQGGLLDGLPLVGAGISQSIGEFPFACLGYVGLSKVMDAVI